MVNASKITMPAISIIPIIRLVNANPLPLYLPGLLFILVKLIDPKMIPIRPNGIPRTNNPARLTMKPASPRPSVLTSSLEYL